jgi:hypothetical protein
MILRSGSIDQASILAKSRIPMFCGAGFCGEGFDPTVSSSCNPFVSVDSIHVFCCCFLLIQFLSGEFFKLGSFF